MLPRIFYTIKQAFIYKEELVKYSIEQNLHLNTVTNLSNDYLIKHNIEALILDFDGVLASHGEEKPNLGVELWLKTIYDAFQGKHIFILSNKPNAIRLDYFQTNYPNIYFIKAKRKKPYPDGIKECLRIAKVEPSRTLVIDDRLLTGVLATIITKTRALLITKPYTNFGKRPIKECFFECLRYLERTIFSTI